MMMKKELLPIENERVRLRLLNEADLPLTLQWRNQDHIRKWFFFSDVLTSKQHISWFQRYLQKDNDFVFIIEDVERGYRPVGQVSIYNIDWDRLRGEFGRLMIGDQSAAGKGLAKSATILIVMNAGKQLGLREIYLEVFSKNERAVAVYEKCGFQIKHRNDDVVHMLYSLE